MHSKKLQITPPQTFISHLCPHFSSDVSDVSHERLREMFYIHLYAVTRVFSPWITPRSGNFFHLKVSEQAGSALVPPPLPRRTRAGGPSWKHAGCLRSLEVTSQKTPVPRFSQESTLVAHLSSVQISKCLNLSGLWQRRVNTHITWKWENKRS